jgi:hypothetical protein
VNTVNNFRVAQKKRNDIYQLRDSELLKKMSVIWFVSLLRRMSISHSQYPDLATQFRVSVKLEQLFI